MTIAQLAPIYGGLLLINLIFSFILWMRTDEKLYKLQTTAFLFFCMTMIFQALSSESAYLWRGLAASTVFFAFTCLCKIMTLIAHEAKFPFTRYFYIYVGGVSATLVLHFLNVDVNWMALPALLGGTMPVFATVYKILFVDKLETTFITKCFIATAVLYSLHMLDFAFVMDKPELIYPGFFLACFLIFAFMMFSNASIIESVMQENSFIRMQMQYKVMLTNSSKLASLGEMAGGMAHEINNPLAVIQLQSDILKRSLQGKELERINEVSEALQRITKVIANLHHFSRDTSSDPITSASIKEIVEQTLSFCKARFADQGIQIGHESVPDFQIKCRPGQLAQAMLNLLNNSFESLAKKSDGGKLISIHVEKTPEHALVRVIDNGDGIPLVLKDRIFDPFFTTKEIGEGMGLGLSVSLGMIEAQNGSLELESASNNTSFLIKMPLA